MKLVSLEIWDSSQVVVTTQQIPTCSGNFESLSIVLSHKELLYSLELLSGKEIKHFEILLTKCVLIL